MNLLELNSLDWFGLEAEQAEAEELGYDSLRYRDAFPRCTEVVVQRLRVVELDVKEY